MKTLSPQAVAMLEGRAPIIGGAAKFVFDPDDEDHIFRFWSGYGDLVIESETYMGVGALALIAPVSSRIGGAADGLKITLSAIDADIAQSIEAEDYHQKPVTIRRLIFAADARTLLAAPVFLRGRVDFVTQRESVGGDCALDFNVEGPRRDMNRAGSRIRADVDQRSLGGADDGAFAHISVAGRKMLNWGARPAVAGHAFGGGLLGIRGVPGFFPHAV